MALNSKPQTNFYIKYGPVTNTSAADSLAPVFIAPRYAIHNSAYGNALASASGSTVPAEYSGDSLQLTWPAVAENSIIDTATAAVIFDNPTVKLGSNGAAITFTSAGTSVLSASGPVAGANTEIDGGYSIMPGDQIYLTGGTSSGFFSVVSVGQQEVAKSGGIVAVDSAAVVATSAAVNYTNFTGSSDVIYNVNAQVISSGAIVQADVLALQGDPGYSRTLQFPTGTAVSVGNYGATLTFTGILGAGSGGVYTLSCTAPAASGGYTKLYLGASIAGYTNPSGTVYTSRFVTGQALVANADWQANSDGPFISSGAQVVVDNIAYPVASCGAIYVEYKELLKDDAYTLHSAQTEGITSWVGPVAEGNPLGLAYDAGIQTGYTNFYLMSVGEETDDAYDRAIRAAAKNELVYSLVPLRQTTGTLSSARGVIAYYSDPSISQVKRLWVYNQVPRDSVVDLATAEKKEVYITVDSTGTLTLGSGLSFDNKGVKVGTIVSATVPSISGYETVQFRVTEMVNSTQCKVDYNGAIATTPAVFTNRLNHSEYAKAIADAACTFDNHRINYIFAEPTTINKVTCEDPRYLTAELAAMRGAMAPHAPLTDVPIPGASIADEIGFTEEDYDLMNAAGVWICYRDRRGNMVTRHAITTSQAQEISEEDSAVSNGDNIVRFVRNAVSWLNGQCNVTPALVNKVTVAVYDALNTILSRNYSDLIGPQILSVDGVDIKQDPNNSAGLTSNVDLDLPAPYLDGEFTFNLF